MIEEKDIEVLLRAKKDGLAINVLMVLSCICLSILIFLEVTGVTDKYTIVLATISAVLMGSSAGANKWVSVSRDQLVKTFENIVNRDPDALKVLADKRNSL